MSIELERTKDILEHLGKNKKENQVLIGFAMETEDLIENAKVKLEKKNADYIIANNLNEKGAGFKVDTNKVTIISKNENKEIDLMDKSDLAYLILDYCLKEE